MGSNGSQTVTQSGQQSQQYTPNQPIGSMVQNAGQMATTAAGAPFQQPIAPVAPFQPFQSIGFGETLGLQGMAQPYFNTAGNYLAGSAAPVTGSDVANYLNPFTSNVTAQLQNIFGQQNVQNTGNLVQSAGGVGADRVGVGQANMANQQTLAAGQVYSGLYQQALQAAEQNKQMQAGAGFAFGQMGPAAQAAQQNAVNQLLGAGAQQQQLSQAEMNAIYQNQLAQIAYPFQTAQYLSGITAGLAPAMGGQTQGQYSGQTTYPSPSPFAQALGVGTSLLGAFGGMGGMGALGSMGTALAGGAPFSAASQYLPGGTAFGATPSFQNGGYYPMFQRRGGRVGYDDGGQVDDNYGNLAQREKYQEFAKEIPPAAQGNPIAETFLHDVGFDDGGGIDPTLGQPSPMALNLNPGGGGGLPFPGAGKVSGSPVPQTQLPTGQGGKSGLYGQQMIMHPPPSMPQQGQSQGGMGGLGQLGQLGGSLGKMLGGLGGGAGAGAAGPLDLGGAGAADALGVGDIAAGAGDAAALFALVNRGGRIPRMTMGGSPGAPMMPPTPMGAGPSLGTGPQPFPPPGLAAQLPPRMPPGMPPKMPGMDSGGSIDDSPTIGPGVPMAPAPQVPMPRPRSYPPARPADWDFLGPRGHQHEEARIGAAGGAVHPMMAGEGFDDGGPADNPFTAEPGEGATPPPVPFMDRASQVYHYLTDPSPPKSPDAVPPEAQAQFAHEGHPELAAPAPVMPPEAHALDYERPSQNESAAYGPAENRENTRGPPPEVLAPMLPGRHTSPDVASGGPYESPPFSPFGHGDSGQDQAPLGIAGKPGDLDMTPYRRATMGQETWLPGARGDKDPYQNVTTTRNPKGESQRALGAYGIMNFNLPQWSQEVLGRNVSEQEFLANPKIQDAIYDAKMRQYIKSYGPEGAGRAWLGGEGALTAPMRSDPLGTRVGDYGRDFARRVQQPGSDSPQGMIDSGMRRSTNVEDNRQQPAAGPMGSRRVPFPETTDPNNFARRATNSPWMAVVNAGARMAQTPGGIGKVIGAGIEEGSRTLQGQRQALDTEEAINQRAEHLAMMAQQHLDHYTRMTPHEQASLEETRRYHDMVASLRGSGLWNQERAKLETEPAWMGRDETEKDLETARRLTEGRKQGAQGQQQQKPPGVPDNYVYGTKNGAKGWGDPATMDKS